MIKYSDRSAFGQGWIDMEHGRGNCNPYILDELGEKVTSQVLADQYELGVEAYLKHKKIQATQQAAAQKTKAKK